MSYRTPDPATTIARLTRECERLRGELAAAQARPRGRWSWRDYLAGPIILGGFPVGTAVVFTARWGLWPWIVAMLAGHLWWAWALRYARSDR